MKGSKPTIKIIEICALLGLCDVFRCFVLCFARLAAPLKLKMENDHPTQFGALSADAPEAMHELQDILVSPPILALPYAGGRYIFNTDA